MALYLESRHKNSSIKRAAFAVLASVAAVGALVVGLFAITTALAISAVAFLGGAVWWKVSGKKRFQAAARQAFAGSTNADFMRARHANAPMGRVIEGEVVRRD